jgi:hypothetical protein
MTNHLYYGDNLQILREHIKDEIVMESFSKWDLEHWWKLMAMAGALLAIASAPTRFGPGVLMGLGLLLFGAGQWNNHPIQTKRSGGQIVESYPWHPYFFGLLLITIGIGLFCFGLYRLVAFGP